MTKIKKNIEQLIFCKYSKLMSALKEPRKIPIAVLAADVITIFLLAVPMIQSPY